MQVFVGAERRAADASLVTWITKAERQGRSVFSTVHNEDLEYRACVTMEYKQRHG